MSYLYCGEGFSPRVFYSESGQMCRSSAGSGTSALAMAWQRYCFISL